MVWVDDRNDPIWIAHGPICLGVMILPIDLLSVQNKWWNQIAYHFNLKAFKGYDNDQMLYQMKVNAFHILPFLLNYLS